MEIRAEEISQIIRKEIEGFDQKVSVTETGTVLEAGDGIARVYGLEKAMAGELLDFGKDVVGRVWRKPKGDWDAWNARSLAEEPIVRLILDGTVARVRLDRRATSISLLVALGVRADGQKMLLAIKSMGGEGEAAWRALLALLVVMVIAACGSSGTPRPAACITWSTKSSITASTRRSTASPR